jgi:hypothetical protein
MIIIDYFYENKNINNINIYKHNDYNNNKAKIIDYFILIKLIFYKYYVFLHNDFYKEIIEYLLPIIRFNNNLYKKIYNNYYVYDIDNVLNFSNKYNIKDKFVKLLYKNNNFNYDINNEKYKIKLEIQFNTFFDYSNTFGIIESNGIFFIKITFIKEILFFNFPISSFYFDIPLINVYEIKKINKFTMFDNYMTSIWENNMALIMYNYIISHPIKKIIYYELFKKIILRLDIFL